MQEIFHQHAYPGQRNNADGINNPPKKPWFKMFLSPGHVNHAYRVLMQTYVLYHLPEEPTDMILKRGRDMWFGKFQGQFHRLRIDNGAWKSFVIEHNLEENNGVIFEVESVSSNLIRFNVFILKLDENPDRFQDPYDGDILPEYMQGDGLSPNSSIWID